MLFDALGLLCGLLVVLAVQAPEALAAPWAPGVEASLPANAASNSHVLLGGVSCASAGNCSAVGIYYDRSNHQHVLLLTESGGAWARGAEGTLPANAEVNPFPLVPPFNPAGLSSVSCASAGNCSAVGVYNDSSGHQHGLLLNEVAGRWAPGLEATLPSNAAPAPQSPRAPVTVPDVALASVSCASAGNCSAVGSYWDSSGHQQGLLLTETEGKWAAGVEATLPANGVSAGAGVGGGPTSVSCASAGDCTAVGTYLDSSNNEQGLLLTETAGTWAPGAEAPLPPNAASYPRYQNVSLGSVSCPSAGNCTAVGSYFDSSGDGRGLLLTESGGTWAPAFEAIPPGNAASPAAILLQGVSCASPGNCAAVGSYFDKSDKDQGLLLTESGGVWAAGVEATLPANAGPPPSGAAGVELGSVSCASAGNCTALGFYTVGSHGDQALSLSETAGTWERGVEATPPANAGPLPVLGSPGGVPVTVNSVSCAPGGGGCSAVGYYGDKSGHQQGLLLGTLAVLSRLRVLPKTFRLAGRRVNGRCVKQTATNRIQQPCTRHVKLTVSYRLNIPARVRITIKRAAPGRLSKRRCVAPASDNRTHRRCTRLLALRGTLTKNGRQGSNNFTFNGRIGWRRLGPGAYQLVATPSFGNAQTFAFRLAG